MSILPCHWYLSLGYPHANPMSSLYIHHNPSYLPSYLAISSCSSRCSWSPKSLIINEMHPPQIHIFCYHLILSFCILHQHRTILLSYHLEILPNCNISWFVIFVHPLYLSTIVSNYFLCQFILDQHLVHIVQLLVSYSNVSFH